MVVSLFLLYTLSIFFVLVGLPEAMDYDKFEFVSKDDLIIIIKEQQKRIEELSSEILRLDRVELDNSFKELLTDDQKDKLQKRFIRTYYTSYRSFHHSLIFNDFTFYTITFSPQRFYYHTDTQYKEYILYHLLEIYLNYNAYIYGCFEYHQSGLIHAHVVIRHPKEQKKIQKYLNEQFNHSKKNKYCIDEGVKHITTQLDMDKVIGYINKDCPYGKLKRWFEFGRNQCLQYNSNYLC